MSAKELADFLTREADSVQKAWKTKHNPGSRRPIFQDNDIFVFEQDSVSNTSLKLQVYEVSGGIVRTRVFGCPVELEYTASNPNNPSNPDNSGIGWFTVTAYGRHMRFSRSANDRLIYQARYECPPHNQPDESGSGDPTVQPLT